MQRIYIICLGKVKETWLKEGCAEYLKRLQAYAKTEIIELADEPAPERLSAKEREQLLQREGERLIKAIPHGSYPIALTLEGRSYDSEGFSQHLQELTIHGQSAFSFLIGSSWGLGDNVRRMAKEELSLSKMTLPHQLCRLMLLEQVYRAMGIEAGSKYHK